jgi:hypothetical protein
MDVSAAFALLTEGTDIWRFFQPGASFRNICNAEFKTLTVRTCFTSVEIAPMGRGISTDVVAQAGILFNTIVFPFWGEPVYESPVMIDFTGDC